MTKYNEIASSILESDQLTPVDDSSLKSLAQKCSKLEELQTTINQQEQKIKSLKEQERKLSEEEIPTFLQEKGLTSIRLNSGTEVSVTEDISPGILVAVSFGMGEDEDAAKLKKQIEGLGLVCTEKEDVHWKTMKSFVTEQHNKGVDLPDEFGVHVANKTKIVQKKKIT